MSTIHVAGGETELVAAIERSAEAAGRRVRSGCRAASELAAGDAILDLGAAADDAPAGERERALAAGARPGTRVVRLSLLGAAPDAPARRQRADAAAEEAWRSTGLDVVALRHGIVFGPLGLHAAWQRVLRRSPLAPVPGFDSRLEPLLLEDLAEYCVQAADPARALDPVYDLGCGDVVTHGFFVRSLARELGLSRLVVPVPGFVRNGVAPLLAGPEFPGAAARDMLEALARHLLPHRMNAWDHFDVRPADAEETLTRSVGRRYAAAPRRPEEPFSAWKRSRKRRRPFLR